MTMLQEFVLPSGKFCKIRKMTAGDCMIAMVAGTLEVPYMAIMYSRVCHIDEKQLTAIEFMELDAQDYFAILNKLPKLDGPVIA